VVSPLIEGTTMINATIKTVIAIPVNANQFRAKKITIYQEQYTYDCSIVVIRSNMEEMARTFRENNPGMGNAPIDLTLTMTESWAL